MVSPQGENTYAVLSFNNVFQELHLNKNLFELSEWYYSRGGGANTYANLSFIIFK